MCANWLTIIWWVSLVEQELLTLSEHLSSPLVFSVGSCYSFFSFLWSPFSISHCLSFDWWYLQQTFFKVISCLMCIIIVHSGVISWRIILWNKTKVSRGGSLPKTTSPKPQSSKICIKLAESNRNNCSKMLFRLVCENVFLAQTG